MKKNRKRNIKRLLSALLAVVVAFTFMPFIGDEAYAASGKTKKSIKNANEKLKYVQELPNGKEKVLDPEMFEGDGKVLNPDDETLKDLGIDLSAGGEEQNEPSPEMVANADLPGYEELAAALEEKNESVQLEEDDSKNSMSSVVQTDRQDLDDNSESDGADISNDQIKSEEEYDEQTGSEAGNRTETGALRIQNEEKEIDELEDASTASDRTVEVSTAEAEPEPALFNEERKEKSLEAKGGELSIQDISYDDSKFTVSQPNANGQIAVKTVLYSSERPVNGKVYLYIDNSYYSYDWNYTSTASSYTFTFNNTKYDIKNLSPGQHSVRIAAKATANGTIQYTKYRYFVSSIYDTPSQSGSFAVYSTYFDYLSPVFDYAAISKGYNLYMDYGGVSNYGPMSYVRNYSMGGLSPNTVFGTQIFYGKVVKYNGKNYLLTGKDTGRIRGTGTFRAGIAGLPKIKSVKVKATKVKKRRAGVYGWYTGYYFGSVRYYTYKIKVTVQFKKKPGLGGLYINGVWKPGNKKKYTLTLGPYANYSKPRGKRFNVYYHTAHAPGGYGGYSPMYSKSKKVK